MTAVPGLRVAVEDWTRVAGRMRVHGDGVETAVQVERCAAGRLRDAYPVGARDLEVRVPDAVAGDALSALLRALADAVRKADPACRRVVFAAPEGDVDRVAAAESAGFRYVVDVDLGETALSLLVSEPSPADLDLRHVPGT
ncbi:hypothetical protein ACQPZP_03980 [Spirillospora sp. CA-142024]|uniref:hypothetical protein n=1 Tax=Spirillospora sp. CA-142024 TaxID=3240036 RepID=UPI003D8EB193